MFHSSKAAWISFLALSASVAIAPSVSAAPEKSSVPGVAELSSDAPLSIGHFRRFNRSLNATVASQAIPIAPIAAIAPSLGMNLPQV